MAPNVLSAWTLAFANRRTRARRAAGDILGQLGRDARRDYQLSGTLRGRMPARARFIGRESCLSEVNSMLFGGSAAVAEWADGEAFSQPIDLDIRETWPWSVTRGGSLVIEPWLANVAEPGRDYAGYLREKVSASIVRYLRKARQRGLTFRRSKGHEEDRFFYDQMLVPLVSRRFGEAMRLTSLDTFLRWNGRHFSTEIVFLERAGQPIAGTGLIVPRGPGEIHVQWYGALPEVTDDHTLRRDFMLLLNDYVFDRACRTGARLNLGNSRPFADDGVTHYKRQWGCTLEPSGSSSRLRMRFAPERQSLLLEHAPLLHITRAGVQRSQPTAPETGAA